MQQDCYELFRLIELKQRIPYTVHIYYKKKRILSVFLIMLYILLLQIGSLCAIGLFFNAFGPNIFMDGVLVKGKGKILDFAGAYLMVSSFFITLFLLLWIIKYTQILFYKGPAYTISRQGIMDYRFGLIRWHQIADLELNYSMSIPKKGRPSSGYYHVPIPHVIISHEHPVRYFKGIFRSFFGLRRLFIFVPLIRYHCFEDES